MLNRPYLFLFLLLNFLVSCNAFRIEHLAPSVREVSKTFISASGGDKIFLRGENLLQINEVRLNGVKCPVLRKISSSEIECEVPSNSGVTGSVIVTVHYQNGSFTLPNSLEYALSLGDPAGGGYVDRTLSSPMTVRTFAGKFYLTDFGNHRVLVWNSPPTSINDLPDLVIGQPHLNARPLNGLITPKRDNLFNPSGIWTDGSKLAVADQTNNRVLLWNTYPTTHGAPADIVLGQPNFESKDVNNGAATPECGGVAGRNPCSLYSPHDVLFEEGKLIVTDKLNHRILIWDGWPTQNQEPADHIVGQPSATVGTQNTGPNTPACGGSAGRNACSFHGPTGIYYRDGKLYIADTAAHRVLIFNSIPLTYGTPADIVLGQPTVLAGIANNGSRSASTLSSPNNIVSDGTRVFVSDGGNHRILGWSNPPVATGEAATIFIGQNDFISGSQNKGASLPSLGTLITPRGIDLVGSSLWVADTGNHRLQEFPNPASLASATQIWGHSDPTYNESSNFGTFSDSLQYPTMVHQDNEYTIIVDRFNHRVIIESVFPFVMNNTTNRVVLGQPDSLQGRPNNGPGTPGCDGVAGINRCSLSSPLDVLRVDDRLIVSDFNNKRILIWNSIPDQDQEPADVVIGQADFVSSLTVGPNTPACGGASGVNKCSLNQPIGLASDGTNLVVTDVGVHRVLIWNNIPVTNQAPADVVLGQPTFLVSGANNGPATPECDNVAGLNRCSMNRPYMTTIHDSKLIVTDYDNNRVLIWNSVPALNQAPADVVIGQADFVSNSLLPVGLNSFARPIGVCVGSNGKLAVADSENHRVLVFNSVPTTNNPNASYVIGQDDSTSNGVNIGLNGLNRPFGVGCHGNTLMISDAFNSRVLFRSL